METSQKNGYFQAQRPYLLSIANCEKLAVTTRLLALAMARTLLPGDKFEMGTRATAKFFNCARTTVEDAINLLLATGLMQEAGTGKGKVKLYVLATAPENTAGSEYTAGRGSEYAAGRGSEYTAGRGSENTAGSDCNSFAYRSLNAAETRKQETGNIEPPTASFLNQQPPTATFVNQQPPTASFLNQQPPNAPPQAGGKRDDVYLGPPDDWQPSAQMLADQQEVIREWRLNPPVEVDVMEVFRQRFGKPGLN